MVKRVLLFFWVLALAGRAHATLTRQLNAEELIGQADRIVVGHVLSVDGIPGRNGGYPEIDTTVQVGGIFKGAGSETIVVRQRGELNPRSRANLIFTPVLFRKGDRVFLFLSGRNEFSGPVGKGQGAFRVAPDGSRVTNRFGNRGLFNGIQGSALRTLVRQRGLAVAPPKGTVPLTLDDWKEMISTHLRETK
ncbi:MAG: hypothetical protein V1495_02345 [Pseudomonadota bacterium]